MTALAPGLSACPHCGTPVEGPEGTYCCHGCELAARIVTEAGLASWYATREQPAPRSTSTDAAAWRAVPLQLLADGTAAVDLEVDGLRCASCVWVAERVLERSDGVAEARVSYATGRAHLRFDPATTSLDALAARIATLGYRPRPAGSASTGDRDVLMRLGYAAFAAMNVMGMSAALYTGWLDGMDPRFVALFQWLSLLLATPVVTWSAAPFFKGALEGLRAGVLHMDLPIALAVSALFGHAVWATRLGLDSYLDSLTMLVALLLGGRLLEARGRKATAEAASALASRVPATARRIRDGGVEEVSSDVLEAGDRVAVGPGAELPADGVVVEGEGLVHAALLTGESRPVPVAPGDRVVAGAVLLEGTLTVGVTRVGADTVVGEMARAVRDAGEAPRAPGRADRLAPAFTAATLGVAAATFLLVLNAAGVDAAIARTAAVLVVACPCALALSTPLVGAAGLGAAARRGVLVRGADALDRLADVDVVVLDKTGTLTGGRPVVTAASDAALRIAAGLERASRHPVAAAILDAAVQRGLPIPAAADIRETAGQGVTGVVDGRRWRLGSGGPGRLRLSGEDGAEHILTLADTPRPGVRADLARLRALGCEVRLLSGDDRVVAEQIAAESGVEHVEAGASPQDKVAALERLAAEGRRVLFVGDGLNDGPALAAAHVGLAMAEGAASSVLAADGVVVGQGLGGLPAALVAARRTRARVHAGLTRSVVYNVVAVMGAVLGWVNPLVAAVLMPLSSGMVIATAARLERDVARRLRAQEG